MTAVGYIEAIKQAMAEEMRRDERVYVLGEDVVGALLGSTAGLVDEFGTERVRNTPISEAGFLGAAAGSAMVGMRPVVDMMIASFLYVAFDQLVSIIAKSQYMYGNQAAMPITIRASLFYGINSATQHSDRPLSTLATIPGLKVIAPTNPYDAKGLLKAAIRDDDPVVCFEDAKVWSTKAELPDGDHVLPLGKADIKRQGTDVTVVAVAGAVRQALRAADALAEQGISVEVLDPRTIVPLDREAILESVAKTGRLVVADICHQTCSIASEVSATVAEEAFWSLQAPIVRVTTPDTHIPFSSALEPLVYPTADRISAAVRRVME